MMNDERTQPKLLDQNQSSNQNSYCLKKTRERHGIFGEEMELSPSHQIMD